MPSSSSATLPKVQPHPGRGGRQDPGRRRLRGGRGGDDQRRGDAGHGQVYSLLCCSFLKNEALASYKMQKIKIRQ